MTDTSELVKRLDTALHNCRVDHMRPSTAHLEQARNGLRKAAQAIERLEREKTEAENSLHKLLVSARKKAEKAERELAEARAREERLGLAVQSVKMGTGNHWAPPHCLDLKATSGPEAQEFMEALADYKEALAAPAPEPRVIPDGAHHSGLMKDYGGRYNPAFKATPTSEAELEAEWREAMAHDDCLKRMKGRPFPKRRVTVQGPMGEISVGGTIRAAQQQEPSDAE